jgi:hypothetical protein
MKGRRGDSVLAEERGTSWSADPGENGAGTGAAKRLPRIQITDSLGELDAREPKLAEKKH